MYTTLEPCIATTSECAKLLKEEKVGAVVIGSYDPNPQINRRGWEVLRDGGIKLRDFDADLRPLIEEINSDFVSFLNRVILSTVTGQNLTIKEMAGITGFILAQVTKDLLIHTGGVKVSKQFELGVAIVPIKLRGQNLQTNLMR